MRSGPLVAALGLILVCAVAHGFLTQRWSSQSSVEMKRLVGQYEKIPATFGEWVSKENVVRKGEMKAAGAHAHISRTYRNLRTNAVVGVFMICGNARDVIVHTPEACYVAQGFQMLESPMQYRVPAGGKDISMYMSTFKKGATLQQICWAWDGGKGWEAPNYYRFRYLGREPLTKIYLITDGSEEARQKSEEDPTLKFADEFLPMVDKILYPGAG